MHSRTQQHHMGDPGVSPKGICNDKRSAQRSMWTCSVPYRIDTELQWPKIRCDGLNEAILLLMTAYVRQEGRNTLDAAALGGPSCAL